MRAPIHSLIGIWSLSTFLCSAIRGGAGIVCGGTTDGAQEAPCGSPSRRPGDGCLPVAVASPGSSSGRFCSRLRGSICSRRLVPAALSFLQGLSADQGLPSCNDLVRAPKGQLPLSPVGTGDCRTACLRDGSCRRRRRRRRLGGGGLLPLSLPGFALASRYFSTDVACLRLPFVLAKGASQSVKAVLCCSSLGFLL